MTLAPRLTLIFLFFALLLVGGVGGLSYASGRAGLQAATISELLATAIEKEAALNNWVDSHLDVVVTIAASPALREAMSALAAAAPDSADARAARDRLVAELAPKTGEGGEFLNLLVLQPGTGRVIAATDPSEEGKFREDQPYFIQGQQGPFVQNLYFSPALQTPVMTVSAPLRAADGRLLGVLAGRLDLSEMNAIVNRRTGLRQSDEAFLVNTSNLFATQPRLNPDPAVLQRGVHTEAVNRCLEEKSGVISAIDYRGNPALVVYRWSPQRGWCQIVKIDQPEAFAPVRAFGVTILLIGALTLLAAAALAVWLARTITRPLLALQNGAERFGQGDFQTRLPETASDELGHLAREFNRMAAALAEKDAQLRGYAEGLEKKVQERSAALLVSEASFRLLFANNPLPMWVYAPDTLQFIEVNDTALANYGYTRAEFLAMTIADIRPPEELPRLRASLQQERPALQRSGEWRHRLKDGRLIDVEIISHRFEFVGRGAVLVVAFDITERKRGAEALRKQTVALARSNTLITALSQVALRLATSSDTQDIMDTLGQELKRLNLEGVIALLNPDGQSLVVTFATPAGAALDLAQKLAGLSLVGFQIKRQRWPGFAQVLDHGLPSFIPNSLEWVINLVEMPIPQPILGKALALVNLQSDTPLLCLPLIVNERVLGLLMIWGKELQESDTAAARVFGAQLAAALENARLYQAMQRELRERKLAEEQIFYQANLVAAVSDAIIATDLQFNVRSLNPGAVALYGWSEAEALGRPVQEIIHNEYIDTQRQDVMREFREKGFWRGEVMQTARLGRRFPVLSSVSAIKDGSDKVIGAVAVNRDITERTRAQEALVISETRYRRLFESAQDGILILDGETGMIVDVNPFLLELLGFRREQFLEKKIWELGLFVDIAANQEAFAELLREEYIRFENLPLETRAGLRIEVEFVSYVYQMNQQKLIQCNIRNITDRVKAEQEIRRANVKLEEGVLERTAQLEAANKELEAFSYSVSHDLRAPLRAISGFARILLEDFAPQLEADSRRYLSLIATNTQQMGQLVDDLLAFSRLGRQPVNKETIQPEKIVRRVLAELQDEQKNRALEVKIGDLAACQGDPALLQQVWANLIANALKFSRTRLPAQIEIGSYVESPNGADSKIIYYVRDNGVGFDMQYAHKLFGVFQRLHRADEFEGTGVGLAIVQRVIHRHGGRIWAEAKPEAGATFYFTL